MVKLVAKQPIDPNVLPGLSLLFSPSSVIFDDRESDGFTATLNDTRLVIGGSEFSYFFSKPKAVGTVATVKVFVADVLVYKLSGADVKLRDIVSEDVTSATLLFFEGDDIFKGSPDGDTFYGRGGHDILSGRGGNDSLLGQDGKDVLDGGDGSDTLNGGHGKDTYSFKTAPSVDVVDTIVKFKAGETIQIAKSAFAGLVEGPLADDQFVRGAAPGDENDRFLYDPTNGTLSHDPDGTGSAATVRFAQMQPNLDHFSADNFIVI